MKIKYLLVISLIIVLSGCKAVYKLEIKDKDFKENVSISADKEELNYFKNNKFYAIMNGASNFVEYNKKVMDNKVDFKYNYNDLEYSKSTTLKTCFNAYNVIKEGNYYILSTSKGIKCATEEDKVLLDSLDIVIKTNHVVKESNANKTSNNKHEYVWHFDKSSYSDGRIYLKLYKDKYVFNYENEFTIKVAIIALAILTILITAFIIRRRVKKAGEV